jgi:thioesterase domain-containing protein
MRDLAMAMPPDQPFYCLQSRGLDGQSAPFSTIEEAAECYVGQIRTIQPHGPYFLGGWSSGGSVAFEMACRLQSMGENVSVVALFDALNFEYARRASAPRRLYFQLGFVLYRLKHHLRLLNRMRLRDWSGYLVGRARVFPRWAKKSTQIPSGTRPNSISNSVQPVPIQDLDSPRDWIELFDRVADANTSAAQNFIPKPYDGHLLVFRAENRDYVYPDKALGWRGVALGGVTAYEIDGDHESILRNPNVSAIADKLDRAIREAQRISLPQQH